MLFIDSAANLTIEELEELLKSKKFDAAEAQKKVLERRAVELRERRESIKIKIVNLETELREVELELGIGRVVSKPFVSNQRGEAIAGTKWMHRGGENRRAKVHEVQQLFNEGWAYGQERT